MVLSVDTVKMNARPFTLIICHATHDVRKEGEVEGRNVGVSGYIGLAAVAMVVMGVGAEICEEEEKKKVDDTTQA